MYGLPQVFSAVDPLTFVDEEEQLLGGDDAQADDADDDWDVEWVPDGEQQEPDDTEQAMPPLMALSVPCRHMASWDVPSLMPCGRAAERRRPAEGQAAAGGDAVLRHRQDLRAGGGRRQWLCGLPPREVRAQRQAPCAACRGRQCWRRSTCLQGKHRGRASKDGRPVQFDAVHVLANNCRGAGRRERRQRRQRVGGCGRLPELPQLLPAAGKLPTTQLFAFTSFHGRPTSSTPST